MSESTEKIKLTQFTHGFGCGCKIAPAVLDVMLKNNHAANDHPGLLVGNSTKDDAAVLDLGNGKALITTTDFFMPIVDDAFDFGKIAAVNAISDVYAMGGTPNIAVAILGWPIEKLAPEIAAQVLAGGRAACAEAGIPLAGGHSIDSPEPIFGLAVNGMIEIKNLKTNSGAKEGDLLFITKSIGVGVITTAAKKGIVKEEDLQLAVKSMSTLNKIGAALAELPGVHAITDVTGFGVFGHLLEMLEGSGLSAILDFAKLPLITNLEDYLAQYCIPAITYRNWNSYSHQLTEVGVNTLHLGCDPQTSGGLLIAVDPNEKDQYIKLMKEQGYPEFTQTPIGTFMARTEKHIRVVNGEG
ncbi:selenide, water dikinase SelD [soil metagenome]